MEHLIIYKKPGAYSGWPLPSLLPDGRLCVVVQTSDRPEHYAFGTRITLVSDDAGQTWAPSDDPSLPSNWPASSTREGHDRFERVMPGGRYLAAGGVGFEQWSIQDRKKAESQGRFVADHPDPDSGLIVVGGNKLFVQWSDDQGATWQRREWRVPRAHRILGFPRTALLTDGTVLVPAYDELTAREIGTTYIIRVTEACHCELIEMPPAGRAGNEFAVVETSPGVVLAHIRDTEGLAEGYLHESWSHDGGRSWSHPVQTTIWGYPPHLLRLADGRILCAYSHRRDPMGIRAVLSGDGGRSWDMANEVVLRDDAVARWGNRLGGNCPGDLGYPLSVQLPDETIFTAYYFVEADGVVHCAATKWKA